MISVIRWTVAGAALGASAWALYAVFAWFRYGQAKYSLMPEDADLLLDRFMPIYEVAERHEIRVTAPASIALNAATELNFQRSAIIRAIFKTREFILRSKPEKTSLPPALLAQVKALGWGVLAEIPGREVVMGAVTRPWEANVVFRTLPPEEFAAFHEPDYVKIAWTLRADPVTASESTIRTETRVATTDAGARAKFRRYWAFLSPGILLIRRISLKMVKQEAEQRARRRH